METAGFALLPGEGVVLPRGGGLLGFGASRERTARLLGWCGAVRTGFVCRVEWYWWMRTADRVVEAWSGGDGRLGEISVSRCACYAWGEAAGIPVVYRDLDVFAHPLSELESVLAPPADGSIGFHRRWQPRPVYVSEVWLTDLTRDRDPWQPVEGPAV